MPALTVAAPERLGLVHGGADGLRRALERGVVGGHLDLRDHRDGVPVHAQPGEVVVEVLLQGVADRALGVRAAHVQGHLVQLVGGQLGPPQDEADLRTVAVCDGHVPVVADHRGDVPARLPRGDVLVPDGLVVPVLDQRIATDRHDRLPVGHAVAGHAIVRTITAFWPCSLFSAWSYTADRPPSITASATSTPRSAGSGCM